MTSSVTQTYPVSVDVHLSGGINVRELAVDQQWKKKKKKKIHRDRYHWGERSFFIVWRFVLWSNVSGDKAKNFDTYPARDNSVISIDSIENPRHLVENLSGEIPIPAASLGLGKDEVPKSATKRTALIDTGRKDASTLSIAGIRTSDRGSSRIVTVIRSGCVRCTKINLRNERQVVPGPRHRGSVREERRERRRRWARVFERLTNQSRSHL